ncbi:MAG: hypothetical protein EOP48_07535 [Sphingobacteriales bacterium]|nr:MAG: hypothetical protein EOP48_07535 [Sphingobacteriales bacterium]
MKTLENDLATVYSFPLSRYIETREKRTYTFPKVMQLITALQVLTIIGLSVLTTCLQAEFYKVHDVLPGYSWPLAIAGSVSMIVLLTFQLTSILNIVRYFVCAAYYTFMVGSASFHVFSDSWHKAALQPPSIASSEKIAPAITDRATELLQEALAKAIKREAWDTIKELAPKVSQPKELVLPEHRLMGITKGDLMTAGAIILIVLRALLEASQAIIVAALRNTFSLKPLKNNLKFAK